MWSGLELGTTLILFFLSSSKLTKWRSELKAKLEAGHAVGGQRGAAQVLANSLPGAALAAALAWVHAGGGSCATARILEAAFVGFYACCAADTWSSEVGIAATAPPRLVTTGRLVPPGTNGGVSLLGTAAAAAAGIFVGGSHTAAAFLSHAARSSHAAAASCPTADWRLVPLALAAGLGGSLLDSLLGATLQWSGFDERSKKAVSGLPSGAAAAAAVKHTCGRDVLSNTGVNVVASLMTSSLAAAAWSQLS